ncbi:MAG: restriction endonuclease subunit S [Rubripirellula sp.]
MHLKNGYHQTEIGILPNDWGVSSIGKVFQLDNGCAFTPEDWKEYGTPIIRIQNLNDPAAKFNYSQAPIAPRNRVETGDLLFAWSGTIGTSFGARIWRGPPGVLNQHIFKVSMDEHRIDKAYALRVFFQVQEAIGKQAHGFKTSFVHVKKADLIKVMLPLPPLTEQRAIAEALSDVDALLGVLDRMLTKKRDLKQAAMQQLLTGQTRLPGFDGEWEEEELGAGVALRSGHHVLAQYCNTQHNGIPYLTGPADFPDGKINCTKFTTRPTTMCAEDDILVTVKGSGAGTLTIADDAYCISRQLMAIRVEGWNTKFVFFSLLQNASEFKAAATGLIPGLSRSDVLEQSLPFPPTVEEQTAIAEVLSDMDAEIAALERRREKTGLLKQGMMQELLTGKTRLV